MPQTDRILRAKPEQINQEETSTLAHGWRARSEGWTWNCFTVNMGTGGVAILIDGCPFRFRGQRELGTMFFFIDLIVFLINVAGVTSRAIYHPRVFRRSFYDHEDGIYVPCFALAWATLFICIIVYAIPYAGPWLVRVMEVIWFVYLAVSLVIALVMEYTVRGRLRALSEITPADCLLVFPLMLGGTTGSALATQMSGAQATYIIIISLAFMKLARTATLAFPAAGLLDESGARIFQVVSIWYSLPLLGLALYLWVTPLVLYITGIIKVKHFRWTMSFWSLTFPLTGMFMAFGQLGEQLPSKTFNVFGSKTLLQPRKKRSEDFRAYHGLHQGEVIEDAHACRRIQAQERDLEQGNVPIKRYIQEHSQGA
ncbi:hypothetical protein QFC19_009274 [Naganishia cerealis]|uniref:Uncharacterized protein n=1 Tax=Naganishia cerealis TaxID=610337 RepID=A0ACC2UXE7_9TREE|nr:hypothetical protein QFC19_009274 [Naganishia cerealis]